MIVETLRANREIERLQKVVQGLVLANQTLERQLYQAHEYIQKMVQPTDNSTTDREGGIRSETGSTGSTDGAGETASDSGVQHETPKETS